MNAISYRTSGCAYLLSLVFLGFCWGQPQDQTASENTKKADELVSRGIALDSKRELDKSVELYTEAIRLDDSHVNAYFRRGLVYLITGQLEKSLADSEKVINLAPAWAYGYWLRGAAYGDSKQLDKAFADYNEAIRLDPQFAEPYHGRGLVQKSRGNLQLALRDLDEAVRLQPRDENSIRVREQLKFELGQETGRNVDGQLSQSINVSSNSGQSTYPVLSRGRDGDIQMVWMDNTPGNFEVFYAKWNGEEWTSRSILSNSTTDSLYPTVVMDLQGQVHVTWMEGQVDGQMHILHSKVNDSNWSKPENISNAKGISQRPQIAVDSSGVVHVVWYGNQGGFFELYHSQLVESQWSEPRNTGLVEWRITHNPGFSRRPALAAGAEKSVHVVWVGMEDVPYPYALTQNIRHSRWDGTSWSKPDNVSKQKDMAANLEHPGIVVGDKGNLHVVWEDQGTIRYGHFAGQQWSVPKKLNPPGLKSASPTVYYSEKGPLHFSWLGVTNGKPQVFYCRLSGEQWSDSVNVSSSPGTAFGCTLALDRSGSLHMAWMDDKSGEYEIIHRRMISSAP